MCSSRCPSRSLAVCARVALRDCAQVRRSDRARLDESVESIQAQGGEAHGFLLDATKATAVETLVDEIESDIGPISCCVYNLGANMGIRDLAVRILPSCGMRYYSNRATHGSASVATPLTLLLRFRTPARKYFPEHWILGFLAASLYRRQCCLECRFGARPYAWDSSVNCPMQRS